MNVIAFMTANYVARETGWAMHGWGHGDGAANERFRPLETYAERIDDVLARVRSLGFDAVDFWGAHLHPSWASDEHVELARTALDRHGLEVTSYAAWAGEAEIERACEIAGALGTSLIGAGTAADVGTLVPTLRRHGIRLAYENHPERTPAELLAKLGDDETVGVTVDTGWWATHGFDPARAIEELDERVLHVHLKDVRHAGEPHETCPWGDGVVDVEACVRALGRIGYTGALTVEHEPEDHDPSDECRELRMRLEEWLA